MAAPKTQVAKLNVVSEVLPTRRTVLTAEGDGTAVYRPGGSGGRELLVVIDGMGSELTAGVKGEATLDFACSITAWRLLADQSGDVVVDIWKDTFANYPPDVSDTITGGSPPTLSGTDHDEDSALSGWTTSVAAGDTFRFNIDSAATITRVLLALSLQEG